MKFNHDCSNTIKFPFSYRDCLEYEGEPRHLVAGHVEVRHVLSDRCDQV